MNALNGKKILSPVFSKIIYACENSWNCTHVIFHTFYMLEEIIYSHKKGHYILIKGPINQDDNDCKDIYIYILNFNAPNFLKHYLYKRTDRARYNNSGDFNTPLSSVDKSSRQKSTKKFES
jgi:hypothetical protein